MNRQKHFIVDILFVLALFALFTISALMLVTVGAEVYRHTVDDMSNNYETRTSVAYLTEKIRQNDNIIADTKTYEETNINITTLGEAPALVLSQTVDGTNYCTYLYFHDGYLKELFMKSETYPGENILSAGQNIMELSALNMEQVSDNLLSIQLVTSGGESHQFFVSTHCTP